ncbi:MAG: hypothetical protein CHACPFDD_02050 [Phycisphaerae bacterium]|nr:hypothetical protein [Phycisphaerae bacterium]
MTLGTAGAFHSSAHLRRPLAGAGVVLGLAVVLAASAAGQAVSADALLGDARPISTPTYEQAADRYGIRLRDVDLGRGAPSDIALERVEAFMPGAQVVLGGAGGDTPTETPPVVMFAGRVVGADDSRAFLALSPFFAYGFVQCDGQTMLISSGRADEWRETVIYSVASLPEEFIDPSRFMCGSDGLELVGAASPEDGASGASREAPPCRVAYMAIDTDHEFTANLFGGNTTAAAAYAATLVGGMSSIYTRDFNCRVMISYLRLWETPADPWDQTDMGAQLSQFQSVWNSTQGGVFRHLAHIFSGRCLGGGVAWVGVVCNGTYGYALSSCLGGYFPYPIQNNSGANWDLFVVAHETGHNFGAPHTHDMNPQIDNCAGGDCSVCPNGTIMSYCHGCPSGMGCVRMEMHTRTVNEAILPHLNAVCSLAGAPFDGVALNFDGADDYVEVPGWGLVAPTTEITIEFWQFSDEQAQRSTFGMSTDQATNRCQAHVPWSTGAVFWDFGNINTGGRLTYSPPEQVAGRWQHFALVASQSGNKMEIYRNGVLEAQKAGMSPYNINAGHNLRIGALASSRFFNGRIDEFRVWNVARSAADIAANYDQTLTGNEPGLFAYYRLDEAQGTVAADSAGNHDGSLVGATWVPTNDCANDTGQCCFFDGTCMTTTHEACDAFGGSYQGDGTSCDAGPCPTPGACCGTGTAGVCAVMYEVDCAAAGGEFMGDGVTCDGIGPFPGYAVGFDGDDMVNVPSISGVASRTEITVELWQFVDAAATQSSFGFSPDHTFNRFQAHVPWSDGVVYWDFGNVNGGGRLAYSPPEPIVGSWQHFAFVASQSGAKMEIYRNGVLEAQKAGMDPRETGTYSLRVGVNGSGNYFRGRIDEFRIWNVARSAAEIAANFNTTLIGSEPNLLLYYRFDEGAGLSTSDLAGNLDGFLSGASWAATAACTAACDPCDVNCDGTVNGFDIDPFVGLLTGGGSPCSPCSGDVNGDGTVSGFDVDGFVTCLQGP